MTIFRSPATAAYPPFDSGTPDVVRLPKDGRKAKRALRRRIQPKQQRCSERMVGPVIEPPFREMPPLPRGGDGLATHSLRPSLGPQGRQEPTGGTIPSSPRRPATASCLRRQGRPQPERSRFAGGHRRLRVSPAVAENSEDGLDQQKEYHHSYQNREEQPSIHPLRPAGETKSTRYSYANADQRTSRNWERPRSSREEDLEATNGGGAKVQREESTCEPAEPMEPQPSIHVDNADPFSNLHSTQNGTEGEEEDAWSQPMDEKEDAGRGATVVLSSSVLLSPRGRARTPAILAAPTDGSYIRGVSPNRGNTCSQDGAEEDWEQRLTPRPHTAQGTIHDSRHMWHGARAAFSLDAADDQPWMAPDNGVGNYMTSKVGSDEPTLWLSFFLRKLVLYFLWSER